MCGQCIGWNFLISSLVQVFPHSRNEEYINGNLVNVLILLLNISHGRDCLGGWKGPRLEF